MAKHRGAPSSRLAVILHADVAGSTALVQRDEQLAHARITGVMRRLSGIVESYGGSAHEIRGDALVAEFGRASDAVCAALAFQRADGADAGAQEPPVAVRIGIALGEVVVADATVTGSGVVLAQRIEQLAAPGAVNITGAVREALPRRLPFTTEDLGERSLKGFDEPVRIYGVACREDCEVPAPAAAGRRPRPAPLRVFAGVAVLVIVAGIYFGYGVLDPGSQDPAPAAPGDPQRPSIAVLPFVNMSGDPDQQYFADGITEDLTTDLSKISGLFVVARNSSFAYKNRSVDVREVSRELGVRYVLEGSVRRVADQIRINAQLVDAGTGGHVWADRFDGAMADVFRLQDEVNRQIVDALAVSLTAAERARLETVKTVNPAAYDALLRGLEQYQRFSRETTAEARRLFLEAIELDPGYARAYANVALTHASDVNFGWTGDREASVAQGLDYARRASELDDEIPQIYLTRSLLYLSQRKHDAAVEAARRMIEVHPGYADGYATLAFVLSFAGEPEEALGAIRHAKTIDPNYSYVYLAVEGRILFLLKRYDEAVGVIEESISRNPAFELSQLVAAAVYAALDRIDDAAWAIDQALVLRPDLSLDEERRTANYRDAKHLEHYIGALKKAGLPE